MCGEGGAHGFELGGDVAEEGGGAVGAGVGAGEGDCVDEGAWVDGVGEEADLLDAFAVEGVAEAVPDDDGEWSIVIFVVIRGGGVEVDGLRVV